MGMQEHLSDAFVKEAKAQGYRSRAAFKLLALDEKDRLLRPGMTVVDLGAAPGGWSQVAAERVGAGGRVIALDLLPMDPIAGVTFIQGDFTEQLALERLEAAIGGRPVDLVLSDMAPNMSGVARSIYLLELALDLAERVLAAEGGLVVKAFQGEGFDDFLRCLRQGFQRVVVRKPVTLEETPVRRRGLKVARGPRGR